MSNKKYNYIITHSRHQMRPKEAKIKNKKQMVCKDKPTNISSFILNFGHSLFYFDIRIHEFLLLARSWI